MMRSTGLHSCDESQHISGFKTMCRYVCIKSAAEVKAAGCQLKNWKKKKGCQFIVFPPRASSSRYLSSKETRCHHIFISSSLVLQASLLRAPLNLLCSLACKPLNLIIFLVADTASVFPLSLSLTLRRAGSFSLSLNHVDSVKTPTVSV